MSSSRSEQLRLTPLDLEQVLSQLIQERENLQAPNAEISLRRPLLPVLGHEALLIQALSNLLGNAVKFVAPQAQPRIRIWTEPREDRVRIWVEDNGIGIPQRYRERIFGMFQRLHGTEAYAGTGIGLAIVRKAAERMRGTIGVESEPGQGSRFWLELPRAITDGQVSG